MDDHKKLISNMVLVNLLVGGGIDVVQTLTLITQPSYLNLLLVRFYYNSRQCPQPTYSNSVYLNKHRENT